MHHAVTLKSYLFALGARLALAAHFVLLASVGFGLSTALAAAASAATAPPVLAQEGPCGANPCGPGPGEGPCGANPCAEVPAGQGPCGANPCPQVPADQGTCGANPCAADPSANPNTAAKPAPSKAAPTTARPAPPSTTAGHSPGGSTTTTTSGGFQNGQAAFGLKISKDGGGSAAAWAIPVGLVVLVGALFFWLVRRHRVEGDPSL